MSKEKINGTDVNGFDLTDLTGFKVEKSREKKVSSDEEEKEFKREYNKDYLKSRVKDSFRKSEKGLSIDLDLHKLSIEDIESLYPTDRGNYTIAYFKHEIGLFTVQGTCIVKKKVLKEYKEHLEDQKKIKREKEEIESKRQLELVLKNAREQGIDINTLLG